jgi:hypothetical protein
VPSFSKVIPIHVTYPPVRNLSCWSLCSPDKNQCGGTTNECTECKYDPSGAAGDYFCE